MIRSRQLLGELAVQHVGRPKVSRRSNRAAERDASQMPLFVDPSVELMQSLASPDRASTFRTGH